jgi:hypothetical protein
MKAFASLVAVFGLSALLLPLLMAQDAKDAPKKAEAKKKVVYPPDATIRNMPTQMVRIKEIRADDTGTETKEIIVVGMDEAKYIEFAKWDTKFRLEMPKMNIIDLQTEKKFTPQQVEELYRQQKAMKLDGVFAGETKVVNVTPVLRVRTTDPPPQYDESGNIKKLKAADLNKLKDRSSLGGYPAELGVLRAGQIVEVYAPKPPAQPKVKPAPPAKKGVIGADPNLAGAAAAPSARIDAVLIFVKFEP